MSYAIINKHGAKVYEGKRNKNQKRLYHHEILLAEGDLVTFDMYIDSYDTTWGEVVSINAEDESCDIVMRGEQEGRIRRRSLVDFYRFKTMRKLI